MKPTSTGSESYYNPTAEEILDKISLRAKTVKTIAYDSYYQGYNSGRDDSSEWYKTSCWLEELPGDTKWGYKIHVNGEDHKGRKFDYYYDGIRAFEIDHNAHVITYFNAHEFGRSDMNNPAKARTSVIALMNLNYDKDIKSNLLKNAETSVDQNETDWVIIIKKKNKFAESIQRLWVNRQDYAIRRNVQEIFWNGTKIVYDYRVTNILINETGISDKILVKESYSNYAIKNYSNRNLSEESIRSLVGHKSADFSYPSSKGKTVSLNSLRGKIVLLDFWESWCGYCILSFPKLNELYKKYAGNKFEIIGVTTENRVTIERLIGNNKISYPNIYGDSNILKDYKIIARPTYILIDEKGYIIEVASGDLDKIEKKLQEYYSTH